MSVMASLNSNDNYGCAVNKKKWVCSSVVVTTLDCKQKSNFKPTRAEISFQISPSPTGAIVSGGLQLE